MIRYILLFIFFVSFDAFSCGKSDIPSKIEREVNSRLFLSFPEYYEGKKFNKGVFKSAEIELPMEFKVIDHMGWVTSSIKSNPGFLKGAVVTVYYKTLGKYHPESNSFSFVGCYYEQEFELGM